jgi:transposase-like protein
VEDKSNTETGINIFIDFSIIQTAIKQKKIKELAQELDVLIATKNSIYVWSKTVQLREMIRVCKTTTIPYPEEEKILHKKCIELREQGKEYKAIADELKTSVKMVGYFIQTPIDKVWTLSDWIIDYFIKDPSIYQKVDCVVDQDEKFVKKFIGAGKQGNVIKELK